MCTNPLVILSQLTFQFMSVKVHVELYDEDLGFIYIHKNERIRYFLTHYKYHDLYTPEIIYNYTKYSYFYVNGVRYRLFNSLPCGSCSNCRFDSQREIERRAIIEAANSGTVLFYTLTYDDFHCPTYGLVRKHVSECFKNLRNYIKRYHTRDLPFTQLYVGEYGTDPRYSLRPHYHGVLFFEDVLSKEDFNFIEDCFQPKRSHAILTVLNTPSEKRGGLLRKLKERNITYSKLYSSRKRLKGFWPYGLIFDLQYPKKNSVALTRYLCKYVTKNLLVNERFCINKERDERHWEQPFIQLPKSVGLGMRHLHLYKDYILRSFSPTFDVVDKVTGISTTIKVPRLYIQKLFPSVGRLVPKCVFTAHLVNSLINELECYFNLFDSNAILKYGDTFDIESSISLYNKEYDTNVRNFYYKYCSHLEISNLKSKFAPFKYLTRFSLKRKQMLKLDVYIGLIINSLHNCHYLSMVKNRGWTDEFDLDLIGIIYSYLDELNDLCNETTYLQLTKNKNNYYLRLNVPDVSFEQSLIYSQNQFYSNDNYVKSKMVYSPFNQIL